MELKKLRSTRRKRHVRKRLLGTPARPRLTVHRTLKHIHAQIVDDTRARTLASASTLSRELKEKLPKTGDKAAAQAVGALIAERALQQGIKTVCFDRGPYRYHGRVRALADSAREAGLEF